MSLDHQFHGSTDWHFPSPTSTPKSVTFPESALKTPKTEAFPPSYFLDAWSTPVVNGHHTPAQTPCFTLSTPVHRPSTSHSPQLRTPEHPAFHVNHFVATSLPLPPVEPARRLSSSPVSMDTAQMQTPPPTRHDASRRSLQPGPANNNNEIDAATPATVIHQTPAQMPSADGLFGQTPFGFPGLHFSPDMAQHFSHVGPMSAPPLLPQSRLFWDQQNNGGQMDVDAPLTHDPFGPTPHKMGGNVDWATFQTTPTANNTLNSQSFQALHDMSSHDGPLDSFAFSSAGDDRSRPSSFVSPSAGVDPNMLFSFSSQGPASSFDTSLHMPQKRMGTRQPYEKQLEDSINEKESARKSRSQHSRTSTNSSSSFGGSRPGLQRSNTDSGPRKPRPSSMDSRSSASSASYNIPRRSSPLKRQSGGSLKAIPEIRRPKTRLVIDENGRARTETVPAEASDALGGGDARRSSEQDLRRQYPGLWADDDSDSDEESAALSRNVSLTMPRRRTSKHARIDQDDLIRSDSFKMPRSSSRPPSGAFDQSSFETVRPTRRAGDNPNRRFSMMDFPTNFGDGSSQDLPMPDSPGDALGALKRAIEGRQKKTDNFAQNTLRAHNQRWAQASADFASANSLYDPFSTSFTASPSTSADTGLATPSTDRSSLSGDSVRCICNGGDDGLTMIQCESCTKWLHMGCVGLNQSKIPPVYVCVYCTGRTPIARGGRVRGPVPAPFDSPLTHKSVFRR